MEERNVVIVDLERYEELIDLESRVNVAAQYVESKKCFAPLETVLRIIGGYRLNEVADAIEQEKEDYVRQMEGE